MTTHFRPGSTREPLHPSHLHAVPCRIGARSEAGDALALAAINQARAMLASHAPRLKRGR